MDYRHDAHRGGHAHVAVRQGGLLPMFVNTAVYICHLVRVLHESKGSLNLRHEANSVEIVSGGAKLDDS